MKTVKKISKKTVEDKLSRIITPNLTVIGIDVAEHKTGVAIIKTSKTYITIEETTVIKVPSLPRKDKKKVECFFNNVNIFTTQLDAYKNQLMQKYYFDKVIIEDCHLQYFKLPSGHTVGNVTTLKALAQFGILVYDRFRPITKDITRLKATEWRKIIGFKRDEKKNLKKQITEYITDLFEIQKKLKEDEIEAIGLALTGVLQ